MERAHVYYLRVPIDSPLGNEGVRIMNDNADGRIMQESLDLIRENWRNLDSFKTPVIMILAIINGRIIGMSSGAIDNGNLNNSITVVSSKFRGMGIGSSLMKEKAEQIKELFPFSNIVTRVAQDNAGSITALLNAGYIAEREGKFKKKNGTEGRYFVFRYI